MLFVAELTSGTVVYQLQAEGPPDDSTCIILYPVIMSEKQTLPFQDDISSLGTNTDSDLPNTIESSNSNPYSPEVPKSVIETGLDKTENVYYKESEAGFSPSSSREGGAERGRGEGHRHGPDSGKCANKETHLGCDSQGMCNDGTEMMAEYTFCVAFSVSLFTDKSTIFSYALNDTHTNMVVVGELSQCDGLSYYSIFDV